MNNLARRKWYQKRMFTVIFGSIILITVMLFTGIYVENVDKFDASSLQKFDRLIEDRKIGFLLWRTFLYFLIVSFMFYRFSDKKLSNLDEDVQKKIRSYKLRMPAYIVFFELIIVQNLAAKLMGMV